MKTGYLHKHAALALDMTSMVGGIWFNRRGRINALAYPKLFLEMKGDFSVKNFDYRRSNTGINNVEISRPD